jgi:hypothetical protein
MPYNPTERRLQLLALGYTVIPNIAKIPAVKGWNTPDFVSRELTGPRADIERWVLRWPAAETTGICLYDVVVIDADIDDPLVETFMGAVDNIAPEVYRYAPMRFGKGPHKRALFCRLAPGEEAFRRLASHRYEAEGHAVEVFGGALIKGKCSRQFGVYGPHSYNEDGSVAAEYSWDPHGSALHEVRRDQLPVITKQQCLAICDAFDDIASGSGWARQAGVSDPASETQRIYDIDEATTRFEMLSGEVLSYDELEQGMRCSASFFDGIPHSTKDRCHVGYSPLHDCVIVNDYDGPTTHYPKRFAPVDPSEMAAQLKAVLPPPPEPPEPETSADLETKAEWLVQTRGYLEAEDRVVELYATSLDCRTTPTAFGRRYRHWHREIPSRSAVKKYAYATDLWEMTAARINLAGVQMRPDQPYPLYEENGRTFKNTYRRPVHAAGGNVAAFEAFMERFLPDPVERGWLLDWMAHKQARPDIPGTAVVFVADTLEGVREGTFGTGRGLMGRIVRKLYGEQYTRAQSFAVVSGASGQSDFNDWLHGSVLVTIDEAQTSPTAYRRGERNATYEVLKELVDPAPKLHRFTGKHRQAFDGMSYCSLWIATNHANAMSIPANDRRFTILRNGRAITPDEAVEIDRWMSDPANIGALSQMLAARDLSGFNMMAPLVTGGKDEMAELAKSDVEEALIDLMNDPERGLAFTKAHIEMVVELNFSGQGAFWRGEFKAAWHAYCVAPKTPSGGYRVTRMNGRRHKVFCFRTNKARVDAMPEAAIRREVAKWGGVTPEPGDISIVGDRGENEGDQ